MSRRTGLAATVTGAAVPWTLPQPAAARHSGAAVHRDVLLRTPLTGAVDEARTAAFHAFVKSHPDQRGVRYPRITDQAGNQWVVRVAGTDGEPRVTASRSAARSTSRSAVSPVLLSWWLGLRMHAAYLGDNSGSSTMPKGAQATPTYDPHAATNLTSDCLELLTWDDFVVVPA